jgi:small subunit ribosomal protein S1
MNTNPESTDQTPDESVLPEESATEAPENPESNDEAKSESVVTGEAAASEPARPVDDAPAESSDEPARPENEAPEVADSAAETAEVEVEATAVESEAVEVTMAEPDTVTEPGPDSTKKEVGEAATREVKDAIESDTRLEHKLKKGQRVEVKLVQVNDKDAFLDWGGPSEGTIASAELKDEKGELRVKEGESFTVIVREIADTVVFTVGRGKGGDLLRMRELESAHEGKIPVPGKVRSTNKGGFEVDLGGVRAFCPFSQIDTIYCENPETHVGKHYPFEIITFERGGRNIVVSRRGLLEADQKEKGVVTRESLEVGAVLKGTVRRIQPYGAFIDIGGLDGLVHVSEISRAHIRSPKDILTVGQEVEVKVVALDALGTKKERVSLSMKALAADPWEGAAERWKVGTTTQGKVVRLTDFGAFVELAPGIDGLVHVSQISSERIGHPNEVLKPNQEIEVRILELDSEAHRISLTMRPEGEEQAPRGGGGGGGRGPRRPYQERAPMEYSSSVDEPVEKNVDVSGMEYDDALAELKKKFER